MSDSSGAEEVAAARSVFVLRGWLRDHENKLWWIHSAYALLLGIAVMWLGARNHSYLRITAFHIMFIWASSLCLPILVSHPRVSEQWAARLRLLINYFNKNFYQQVLFFILPIYYASATLPSPNIVFVLLLGLSAAISTLDIVYDRHLSVRRGLTASFFAFNLFALINVMLPVLWSISNVWTTRLAAVLAAVGFATLYDWSAASNWLRLGGGVAAAILLVMLVELGRFAIPPVPLRVVNAEFGGSVDRESMRLVPVWREMDPGGSRQVYALTAIKAPLGLKDGVRHRWYKNGKLLWRSPPFDVIGGREQGYRLWTSYDFPALELGAAVRVDVETEDGQLIGRTEITVGRTRAEPVS